MLKREKINHALYLIFAFGVSVILTWMLCSYRFLYAVVLLGLCIFGGIGFFPFKTSRQKIVGVGSFFGVFAGFLAYVLRYT